jgi:glycosyltransferase involved in cell wall biosynthesis
MNLSVITICRNPGGMILRTCASMASQTQPCEWLVIDGASTDGTPDRLRTLPRPPDVLVSEPDKGIADAFNKGLARAGGEAVLFLNAGDAFLDADSLSLLARAWDRSRHRWITAGAQVRREDESLLFTRLPPAGDPRDLIRHDCRIWHAATLCETALLREAGGFDTSFRSSMDYELWVRLISRGHAPQVCPAVVARFYQGGASADLGRRHAENRRARAMHGQSNGAFTEWRLGLVNRLKSLAPRGAWAYRLKERLGW